MQPGWHGKTPGHGKGPAMCMGCVPAGPLAPALLIAQCVARACLQVRHHQPALGAGVRPMAEGVAQLRRLRAVHPACVVAEAQPGLPQPRLQQVQVLHRPWTLVSVPEPKSHTWQRWRSAAALWLNAGRWCPTRRPGPQVPKRASRGACAAGSSGWRQVRKPVLPRHHHRLGRTLPPAALTTSATYTRW